MYDVSVVTPFGPRGAGWIKGLWLQAIDNLKLPDNTQFALIDNTGQPELYLRAIPVDLKKINKNWAVTIFQDDKVNKDIGCRDLAVKLACYWEMFIKASNSKYILSLESDVLPQPDTYPLLVEGMNRFRFVSAIACPARSRHQDTMMVRCFLDDIDPNFDKWHFVYGPHEVTDGNRYRRCAWPSLCCVLFRSEVLNGLLFDLNSYTLTKKGCEAYIAKYLFDHGEQYFVDWALQVRHHISKDRFV